MSRALLWRDEKKKKATPKAPLTLMKNACFDCSGNIARAYKTFYWITFRRKNKPKSCPKTKNRMQVHLDGNSDKKIIALAGSSLEISNGIYYTDVDRSSITIRLKNMSREINSQLLFSSIVIDVLQVRRLNPSN